MNRHAVRAPVVDLEEPEGASKWGFVSGYETGLRHRHDRHPKSKESQIRALEKAVTNTAVQAKLVELWTGKRPDGANPIEGRLGFTLACGSRLSLENDGDMAQLAPRRFR